MKLNKYIYDGVIVCAGACALVPTLGTRKTLQYNKNAMKQKQFIYDALSCAPVLVWRNLQMKILKHLGYSENNSIPSARKLI